MRTTRWDVVWWWRGGSERGEWIAADATPETADAVASEIRRMGYFAVKGLRSIGAPEGSPREENARALARFMAWGQNLVDDAGAALDAEAAGLASLAKGGAL